MRSPWPATTCTWSPAATSLPWIPLIAKFSNRPRGRRTSLIMRAARPRRPRRPRGDCCATRADRSPVGRSSAPDSPITPQSRSLRARRVKYRLTSTSGIASRDLPPLRLPPMPHARRSRSMRKIFAGNRPRVRGTIWNSETKAHSQRLPVGGGADRTAKTEARGGSAAILVFADDRAGPWTGTDAARVGRDAHPV